MVWGDKLLWFRFAFLIFNNIDIFSCDSFKGSKSTFDILWKNDRMISLHLQGKPFKITIIQVYATTTDAKEAEVEQLCKDLQDFLELTPQKRCLFHHRELEWKSRKSRNNWSNRQVWPWSTKWSRAKTNSFLREHTGHSKHPLPITQEMTLHMDITR